MIQDHPRFKVVPVSPMSETWSVEGTIQATSGHCAVVSQGDMYVVAGYGRGYKVGRLKRIMLEECSR